MSASALRVLGDMDARRERTVELSATQWASRSKVCPKCKVRKGWGSFRLSKTSLRRADKLTATCSTCRIAAERLRLEKRRAREQAHPKVKAERLRKQAEKREERKQRR